MSLPIVFRPQARSEFDAAANWYEQQQRGLGVDVVAKVWAALGQIAERPELHPLTHRGLRRAVLKRFPYCVYYRPETDRIVIIAVLHGRRDPQIWEPRV